MTNSCLFIPGDDDAVTPAADVDWQFSGALPAPWVLTSGAGLGRGGDGRWTAYPANTPRPYHHPVTLALLGQLVEPARNSIIYNSRPVNVGTRIGSALVDDTTTQTPFGLGGTLVRTDTSAARHGFNLYFGSTGGIAADVPDNSTVSLQFVYKPVGFLRRGIFFVLTRAGVYKTVAFTTENGGMILDHSVNWAVIEPDTDGFFSLRFSVDYGVGTTTPGCHLNMTLDDGSRSYVGDEASGFLVAYFGAEFGTEATSPILSSTALPGLRLADELSCAADWRKPGDGSFGIQYTPFARVMSTTLHGLGNDSIELRTSPTDLEYSVNAEGVNVARVMGTAAAVETERTVVVTTGYNRFWLAQDGEALGVDQEGLPPADITAMRIGSLTTGAAAGPVVIKRIKYWSSQLDRDAVKIFSGDLSTEGTVKVLPVIDVQASRSVPPADNSLTLTVSLTGDATGAKVGYRTIDGTAKDGIDYTAVAGELVFQPGDNLAEIVIALAPRVMTEDRTFQVELYAPIGAVLGTAICAVTLAKADPDQYAPLKAVTFSDPLTADWSFVRATPGYARASNGVWTQVASGQPRIHYIAAGQAGILLEPASEQRLFQSVGGFYLARSTQTTDTTTVTPTGTRSIIWREDTQTGNHLLRAAWNSTVSDWPTAEYTIWLIVKPVGARTRYRMSTKGIDNVYTSAYFDLVGNGTGTPVASTTITLIEPEPMWPGWYRIGIARSQGPSAGVSAEFDIGPVDEANSNNLAGNTANGLDVCHIQVEPGATWTSPIPVDGAAAKTVRDMDVLKAAGEWHKRSTFAFGIRFMRLSNRAMDQRVVQFRDMVPSVDDYGLLVNSAGALRAPLTTSATFRGNLDAAPVLVGESAIGVVSIDTQRHVLFQNGVKSGERSLAGIPLPRVVEHLRFGSKEQDGSQASPIVVFQAAYWDRGLADSEGIVFSANLTTVPPDEDPDDVLPVVSIPSTLSVIEGEIAEIPITRTGTAPCSVNFETKAQSATWSVDYVGVNMAVNFAQGETTKIVPVQTLNDADQPVTPDTFGLLLSAPVGCALGNATGVVTIIDLPRISLPVSQTVEEGTPLALRIDKAGTGACSVTVRTVDPTDQTGSHNSQVVHNVMNVFSNFTPTRTIWVAKTGNDTTGTGASGSPYLTIQKAITEATAGTAIKVKAGTYAQSLAISAKNGTGAAPITIDSADGKYAAVIQGGTAGAAIESYNSSYIAIRGFHIIGGYTGTGDYGAVKWHGSVGNPAKYFLFQNNKVTGVGRDGIKIFSGTNHCVILGNEINGAWVQDVFDAAMVEDIVYAHNTITGTAGFNTFALIDGSRRVEIVGNLINLSDGAGIRLGGPGNAQSETFPTYWKGQDIVAGGFQAYRCVARDNTITNAEAPSINFNGAVECQAIDNYLAKSVTINERVGTGYSHFSAKNTVKDNVFETEPVITVATGNATGNVITGNVMGTAKTDAGASQTFVDAYYKSSASTGNSALPGADYQPIAATTVSFASADTFKTLNLTTILNSAWASEKLLDIVASDPAGCRLGNASCRVTIAQQGAVAPPPDPGIYTRAVGFASTKDCGDGKAFYKVTNLNDTGTGSLRAGIALGDRHIVFEVGGTIKMATALNFTKSNITISGETAPWPGIILQDHEVQIRASNIRISHITVEKGHDSSFAGTDNGDCVKLGDGSGNSTFHYQNIHFSHCSFFWSQDEMIQMWPSGGAVSTVSWHDCIFGEALYKPQDLGYAAHTKVANGKQSQHNYGMLIGYGCQNIDVQHSYFHDMDMRFPFIDHSTRVVVANIVALNTTKGVTIQHNGSHSGSPDPYAPMLVTCRGYLVISGPQSSKVRSYSGFRFHSHKNPMFKGTRVYVTNLYAQKGATSTYLQPGTSIEYSSAGKPYCMEGTNNATKVWVETNSPPVTIPNHTITPLSEDDLYDRACKNAGPRPLERYSHNARSIKKLTTKQGLWVNHESEVGGFTKYIKRDRKLDGTATFPDGETVPALPADSATIAVKRAWLEHFKVRVQGD